ncbi:hypothetical protein PUMCH_001222 [Australozyma saopauloensis]|uniref:RING-type domain-containing protein n=1 Tax=Australozyma saopauloensis TaxID=291208 RepID=A0AAX4H8D5_9ASCO|nr:hypothetical protein PUMCH_001222 [[Candida] saopauloensis]
MHKRNSPASNREEPKERLSLSGLVHNFRFSFDSKKLSPERSTFFSSSTSLTPSSQPFSLRREDESLLTALDVRDDTEEANYLLSSHVGLVFGDEILPPPPPRKSHGSYIQLKFPLRAEFGDAIDDLGASRPKPSVGRPKDICFICKDTLDSKMDSERILTLECGDRIHSDCFEINVECALEYALELGMFKEKQTTLKIRSVVFPICEGDKCKEDFRKCTAFPIDDEYLAKVLSGVSLKIKLSAVNPDIGISQISPAPAASTPRSRESQYFIRDNLTLRPRSDVHSMVNKSFDSYSHLELAPAPCSTRTSFASNTEHEKMTLEQLKSYFLQHFVNVHPRVDMVFVMSLGPLRLADILSVSINGAEYFERTVYLFAEYVAITNNGLHPMLFPLNKKCVISTPEVSVFQFSSKDPNIPSLRLHSKDDAIIEKWGIAVSDRLLLIPVELLTSTVQISELKYTTFKPSLADMGLNVVGARLSLLKHATTRISPIHELDQESIASVYLPNESAASTDFNLEQEMMKIGLLGSPFPTKTAFEESPIMPLRVVRGRARKRVSTITDTDLDSDEELIRPHRNPYKLTG